MADVNHITVLDTFTDDAVDRILSIYENSTNIQGITEIEADRWSTIDSALVTLAEGITLQNAEGDNLDEIGDKLGVHRYDSIDEEYRTSLKIRAYSRNSTGTRPDIAEVLSLFLDTDSTNIVIVRGAEKRLQITFSSSCFDINSGSEEITRLIPLVTNYTVSIFPEDAEAVLGFGAYDSSDSDVDNNKNFGVLGSTGDMPDGYTAGYMPAIVNTYSNGVY